MCWFPNRLDPQSRNEWIAPPHNRYRAVSAGYGSACALTEAGEAVCVGYPLMGPAPSGPFVSITLAWTGHACALQETGEAVCWGSRNYQGELDVPRGAWEAIDAGDDHTCALSETGEGVCWGEPAGLLPDPPLGRYTAVGTSGYDTCLLTDAGDVYCRDREAWESGAGLQLVSEGVRSAEISVGLNRTCALANSGAIVCWGDTQHAYAPFLVRHGYQRWR